MLRSVLTAALTVMVGVSTSGLAPASPARQVQQDDPLRFARSLYRDGLYDLAVDDLRRRLVAGLPLQQSEDARWLLAEALEASRQPAEAAAAYTEFTRRHSTAARTPQAWLKAGQLYAYAGDHENAAGAYSGFISLFPTSDQRPAAEAGLIEALLARGRLQEALTRTVEARRTWRFHPIETRLVLLEAHARAGLGETEPALALASQALESATEPAERAGAAATYARLLADADQPDQAAAVARAGLAAEAPGAAINASLRALLGAALAAGGDPRGARAELQAAAPLLPANERAEALLWLARVHRATGEPDSALATYAALLPLLAASATAPVALEGARAALEADRPRQALSFADHASVEGADSEQRLEAATLAADILTDLNRPGEALERLRRLLEAEGVQPLHRAGAALAAGRIVERGYGDLPRAAGYYRLAATFAGTGDLWAEALWAAAQALAAQGAFESAVNELRPLTEAPSPWGDRASDRIAYWQRYRVVDLAEGLGALQQVMIALAEGEQQGRHRALLQIARANAGALKDFETAVAVYGRYLAGDVSGQGAAQAHLEMGRALEALATVAEVEQGPGQGQAHRERAGEAYRAAVRAGGDSEVAEEAEQAAIELDLTDLRDRPVLYYQAMRDRYRAYLDRFTDSRRLPQVLLRIGQANEGLGRHADPSFYEEAVSVYRILLEGNRPPAVQATARLGLGRSLFELGQWEEAAVTLEGVRGSLPDGAGLDEVLFKAGQARLQSGEGSSAMAHFQELETRFPQSSWTARASEAMGDLAREQGQGEQALASYRLFEQQAPAAEAGRARFKLARTLYEAGRTTEAIPPARQAARDTLLDSDYRHRALALWGRIAEETGDTDQAVTAYRALWEGAPASEEAWSIAPRYGELLSDRGEAAAAERVWTAVAARAEGDSLKARAEAELVFLSYAQQRFAQGDERKRAFELAWRGRREILDRYAPLFLAVEGQVRLQRREWAPAERLFEEILRRHGNSTYAATALYGLGEAALRQEKPDAGRARFEDLLQRFPDRPEAVQARFQLAQRAYLAAEYEIAVPLYRQVAAEAGRTLAEAAQDNLVAALERMGSYEAAQQEALSYMERFPDSENLFEMKIRLSRLYRDGGQLGRARDYLAALEAPDSETQARLRFQLAETHFAMGNYEDAVVEYLKVAYLNEDQFLFAVTARLQAADSYALMGQRDRAVMMYREIIQRHGAESDYGRTARAHMENVEAGRSPRALPPVPPPRR